MESPTGYSVTERSTTASPPHPAWAGRRRQRWPTERWPTAGSARRCVRWPNRDRPVPVRRADAGRELAVVSWPRFQNPRGLACGQVARPCRRLSPLRISAWLSPALGSPLQGRWALTGQAMNALSLRRSALRPWDGDRRPLVPFRDGALRNPLPDRNVPSGPRLPPRAGVGQSLHRSARLGHPPDRRGARGPAPALNTNTAQVQRRVTSGLRRTEQTQTQMRRSIGPSADWPRCSATHGNTASHARTSPPPMALWSRISGGLGRGIIGRVHRRWARPREGAGRRTVK